MQHTKMVNEARPRRGMQVVLSVPSWRARSMLLAIDLLLFLLIAFRVFFAGDNMVVSAFWLHSCITPVAFPSAIFVSLYVLLSSLSKELNRKRQQAARYNMTAGAWERALVHTRPGVPDLPDTFTISSERSWPATLIAAFAMSILATIIGAIVYSDWMQTLPLVQQGVLLFWVILNTGVNFALFLCVVVACLTSLIFSPRQQISATREGLFCRLGRRTSLIPWQQANLFAVIGQVDKRDQQPVLIYELASKDTIIRWPSSNRSIRTRWRENLLTHLALSRGLVRRSPAADSSFAQEIQILNVIVAERSGLPLYDLR